MPFRCVACHVDRLRHFPTYFFSWTTSELNEANTTTLSTIFSIASDSRLVAANASDLDFVSIFLAMPATTLTQQPASDQGCESDFFFSSSVNWPFLASFPMTSEAVSIVTESNHSS